MRFVPPSQFHYPEAPVGLQDPRCFKEGFGFRQENENGLSPSDSEGLVSERQPTNIGGNRKAFQFFALQPIAGFGSERWHKVNSDNLDTELFRRIGKGAPEPASEFNSQIIGLQFQQCEQSFRCSPTAGMGSDADLLKPSEKRHLCNPLRKRLQSWVGFNGFAQFFVPAQRLWDLPVHENANGSDLRQ
jgi:hypothetical protein